MAVLLLLTLMAESKSNANNSPTEEAKPTIFHDFLGGSCASDSSPAAVKPAPGSVGGDGRLSEASASLGASSGGGRGPISTTSDLGSERRVGNHFEGVPFYGARNDLTGSEISNRFTGTKRSNSDSTFPSSSRDGFPQVGPDSLNGLHLMKMLRNAGGERPRRSPDEATFFGVHPMRPTPTTLMLHPAASGRADASKWERAVPPNISPVGQYPPRVGQSVTSFGCQVPSNRFRDANAGPLAMSQAAADEGSRTGIKGPGILSSVNTNSAVSDRIPSGVLLSASKQKFGTQNAEPEFSTPLSRHGLASAGRQMTIFYGGQAHVFDDVHPNKADVIMALAGSNGGSWSTTYLPKSAAPVSGESFVVGRENEIGVASNFLTLRELHGRLSVMGTSSHGIGSGDQISMPTGQQGSRSTKDGKTPVQATETGTEEKR